MSKEFKNILKSSSIYGLASVLSRAIGFLMIPVYTRFLTPADYGVIEMLDLTSYIITLIVGFSLSNAILRFYYEYPEQKERDLLVSTSLLFVACTSAAAVALLLPFSGLLSETILKTDKYTLFFALTLITLLFQVLAEDCLSLLQVQQKPMHYAVFFLIRMVLGLSLNILFVVVYRLGAAGIVYSGLASSAVCGVALCVMTFRKIGFGFSREKLGKVFRYSAPLIFTGMSTFVVTFSNRYFLNHYASLSEVGIFSLGYKMSMLIAVFVTSPFLMAWQPKRFEIAKRPDAADISKRIFTYFAFVCIFVALGLSLLIGDVLRVITTPEFYGAAAFVPVLAVGYILNGFYYHFNYGLYLKYKTKYVSAIWISAAAFNLGANYILARWAHGMGAAWATMLTYLYIAVVTYVMARRLYPLPYEWGRFLKLCAVGLALFFGARAIHPESWPASVAVHALATLAFPAILYLSGFFSKEEIEGIAGFLRRGRKAAVAAS